MDSEFARGIIHTLMAKGEPKHLSDSQHRICNIFGYLKWHLDTFKPVIDTEFLESHTQDEIDAAMRKTSYHNQTVEMLEALVQGHNHPIIDYIKSLEKMNMGGRKKEALSRNTFLRNCEALAILLVERNICRTRNMVRVKIVEQLQGDWNVKKLEYVNHKNFPDDLRSEISQTTNGFRTSIPSDENDVNVIIKSFLKTCKADGLL